MKIPMRLRYMVYTIGHSNHTIEYFVELLQAHAINCVIDVRSVPHSAYSPQFNKENLQKYLKYLNINYLHFGKEFGACHTEAEVLDGNGNVDFEKVRKTKDFLDGVTRLRNGLDKGYTVAIMCSEAEPFDCHRFSLISYYLARNGFDVKHILKDKSIINNADLEELLLKKYSKKLPQRSLFDPTPKTKEDKIYFAYSLRNKDIAFNVNKQ